MNDMLILAATFLAMSAILYALFRDMSPDPELAEPERITQPLPAMTWEEAAIAEAEEIIREAAESRERGE